MSWVRLDDQFTDHPKVLRAGAAAAWFYVCGLAYSSRYLTDGFVPIEQIKRLADVKAPERLAAALVESGLWELADGGYLIHDWLNCKTVTDQQMLDELRAFARRHLRPAVFARDGSFCATCKSEVDPTIDHIIPLKRGGTNEIKNLQVLCRSCNSRKGAR